MGAVESAERTPSIVAADRMARALGTTLAEMFGELAVEGVEGALCYGPPMTSYRTLLGIYS